MDLLITWQNSKLMKLQHIVTSKPLRSHIYEEVT